MDNKVIFVEDKNIDKAIEKGLKELDVSGEEVDIEILEEPRSFMGVSMGKFKLKLRIKDAIVNLENIEKALNESIEKKECFEINYNDDGVYLLVHELGIYREVMFVKIIEKLKRKNVKDYDCDLVHEAIQKNNNTPVKIAPFQEEKLVDAKLVLDITQDKLACKATLLPPDGGDEMNINEAYDIVKQNIKYGLIKARLEELVNNKIYGEKVIIAEGKDKNDGNDGYIKYYFDINKKVSPELLEDGSVDYRRLNLINNVKEGQILVEIFPATEGRPGIDVLGNAIPQQCGKEPMIKNGRNVKVSEDGFKFIAACDGQVYLNDDKLDVNQVFQVSSDVDTSTGNIEFNGAVIVEGNVRTGFEIKAAGDIEVRGVVEGAIIESQGNVVLKRGIHGHHKGKLYSKEGIIARYIENCHIYAMSDVSSDAIMHSEVVSESSINVTGKKGLIVGGVCKAKYDIYAKTIGSSMETSTTLEVGIDPSLKKRSELLKEELSNLENNTERLDKSITLLSRLARSNNITEDKKEMLIKFLKARKQLYNKKEELNGLIVELDDQIETLSNGKIVVEKIIFPGVKIVIGNSIYFIKEPMKRCTIFKQDGEIKITSSK